MKTKPFRNIKRYWGKQSLFIIVFLSIVLTFNSCTSDGDYVAINEVCGNDNQLGEWIELYNPTSQTVYLNKGWRLLKIDEDGVDHVLYNFKNDSILPHGFLLLSRFDEQLRSRISGKKEIGIELVNPQDKTVESFYRDDEIGEQPHKLGGSYARYPDGIGRWNVVETATPDAPNSDDISDETEAEFDVEEL